VPLELNDSYETIYQRSMQQMAFGETEEALEGLWRILRRLTRLKPETLQRKESLQALLLTCWNSLVTFLRWEERYDEAISACETVRSHLSAEQGVDRRIASLTIERGNVEEGLDLFRQAVDQEANVASWADMGAEYVALERYDDAESCYKSALPLAQSNEEATIVNLGLFRVYRELGQQQQALSAWNMAAVLDPDLGDMVSEVYTWLIERGDLEEAEKHLSRERNVMRRRFHQGLLEWTAGRQEDARARWRSIVSMELDGPGADPASWIEAALRLDSPQTVLDQEATLTDVEGGVQFDVATLLGLAHAMRDQLENAHRWFQSVVRRMEQDWPRRSTIPADMWRLAQTLILNTETLAAISKYFESED